MSAPSGVANAVFHAIAPYRYARTADPGRVEWGDAAGLIVGGIDSPRSMTPAPETVPPIAALHGRRVARTTAGPLTAP